MAYRLGICGKQNSGKSFTRRYIPDGHRVAIVQPSKKASYLYTGPDEAADLSMEELDAAIKEGRRKLIKNFDMVSPKGNGMTLKELVSEYAMKTPHATIYDLLQMYNEHKPSGYLTQEHIKGNVFYAPTFRDMKIASEFVNKHMPWVHTLILPDFTHFITERLTSDSFLAQTASGQAYARYLQLAADSFKTFIQNSDNYRDDLIVVTEYHVEENKEQNCFEIFVPGGKMVKEKFLPSSYYDQFLFTTVEYESADRHARPIFQYVTCNNSLYPEARSGGLFDSMLIPNNLNMVLTAMREHYGISIN